MKEAARFVLQLMRAANRANLDVSPVLEELIFRLHITNEECNEIGEIIKADIQEMNVASPHYGIINERLRRMGPENPEGV